MSKKRGIPILCLFLRRVAGMSRIYLAAALALAACDTPTDDDPLTATEPSELVSLSNCVGTEVPAHSAPTYVRPADDSVVLQTLIDGAGYAMPSNSNWVDIAAGNVCGGPEKELVLLKNAHSNFTVMRGPVPYAVGSGDLNSDPAHPWRAVAVGDLDGNGYDEIVAIRHTTLNATVDVVVAHADPTTCFVTTIVASAIVGNAANSDWVDVAIGNFDGTGKQIAMLKKGTSYLLLYKLTGSTLTQTRWSNLAGKSDWRGVAAADLDNDGTDELIVGRKVTDGVSGTIFAFKWNGTLFKDWKTSTFGNTGGGSSWASLTAGDFNGDGRAAVVAVKNEHSNFAVFDVPTNTSPMRVVATSDLDSSPLPVLIAPWRGIVAVDWNGGDQGAAELVAVRAPTNTAPRSYRADLFVYGNSFHRAERDSALLGTKAAWDQDRGKTVAGMANSLVHTHTNTLQWTLATEAQDETDYRQLLDFLDGTKNLCIDGRRLRVWVTLKFYENNSWPADPIASPFNDFSFFHACDLAHDPTCRNPVGGINAVAHDFAGWGGLFGRLAQDFPQLVAVTIDDYTHHPEAMSEEQTAEMQSRMRSQAPWLNFVPLAYTDDFTDGKWPDLAATFDSLFLFFRDSLERGPDGPCLADGCPTDSVPRMPDELAFVSSKLPAGRSLQLGTYWVPLWAFGQVPTVDYDYRLMSLALQQPSLGGVSAYSMQPDPNGGCNDFNFLDSPQCALWKTYGAAGACTPGEVEPCGLCGTRTCGASFTWGACSSQGVCTPGTTRTTGCGDRCGFSTDTCSASCQWTPGTCGNEGECRPGQRAACCPCRLTGCSCSGTKTCETSCSWGPCLGATCNPNQCLAAPADDGTEPQPAQP